MSWTFFAWALVVFLTTNGLGRIARACGWRPKEPDTTGRFFAAMGGVTLLALAAGAWFHPTIWSAS